MLFSSVNVILPRLLTFFMLVLIRCRSMKTASTVVHMQPPTHTLPAPFHACTFQLQFLREQRKDAPMWMKCLLLRWCVIIQMEVFFLPISTHHLLITGWFFLFYRRTGTKDLWNFTKQQSTLCSGIHQRLSAWPGLLLQQLISLPPACSCYQPQTQRSWQWEVKT